MTRTTPRSRPGGRSARVVRDVLAATIDLLAEKGFAGLAMEDVAARAQVNKTTVYRRWPTKAELLHAALSSLRTDAPEVPDTGSLRGDLEAVLAARVLRLSSPRGRTIARAVTIGALEPELGAVVARLRRERPVIPPAVFERAIARGELSAEVDRTLLAEALVAPITTRVLWKDETVGRAFIGKLVRMVVEGAANERTRAASRAR